MRLILIRQIIKFLNFQMLHTSSATSTYVCRSPGTLVIKLTLYEEYIKLGFTASKMYSAHNEMQRHARFSSFWSDRHFCSQIHPRLFYGSTLQTFNSIAYYTTCAQQLVLTVHTVFGIFHSIQNSLRAYAFVLL